MSEAVFILQRAAASYGAEQRVAARQLEKVEAGSDAARALTQRVETLKDRRAQIVAGLHKLGAQPPPEGADHGF